VKTRKAAFRAGYKLELLNEDKGTHKKRLLNDISAKGPQQLRAKKPKRKRARQKPGPSDSISNLSRRPRS
jgi:hypothetical protein